MSGRCPTGWPHDSHAATLISVPPLWVCTPVLTCCINCGLHRGLCTSSVVLLKTKQKAPKEQADWSCAKALHECRRASLDTGSIAMFAGTSACWVTGQEGGHCGWKVARAVWHSTYGFSHSRNKLSEISSWETDSCLNCHCRAFHGATEMNLWTSKVHNPKVPSKNPIVSKGNFLKVKELQTLAHKALLQAVPGLWEQGSRWNIFLAIVPGK